MPEITHNTDFSYKREKFQLRRGGSPSSDARTSCQIVILDSGFPPYLVHMLVSFSARPLLFRMFLYFVECARGLCEEMLFFALLSKSGYSVSLLNNRNVFARILAVGYFIKMWTPEMK